MTKEDRQEREKFIVVITRNIPPILAPSLSVIQSRCEEIMRLAKRHGRIQEHRCNREISAQEERQEERLEQQITENLRALQIPGSRVRFSGDPRGFTVKLILPDKSYNTWGGVEEGYGVPQ